MTTWRTPYSQKNYGIQHIKNCDKLIAGQLHATNCTVKVSNKKLRPESGSEPKQKNFKLQTEERHTWH